MKNNDVNSLFDDTIPNGKWNLDIDVPKSQKAITTLPKDFEICSKNDILMLEEYVSHYNKAKWLCLYRGHESNSYKIESTIARHLKNKKCTIKSLVEAEHRAFDMFCREIYKENWSLFNADKKKDILYKMSIGRHLGLPCRLIDVTTTLETAIWFAVMNPKFYNKDGEIVLIVLDKERAYESSKSPFDATGVSYAHEPFIADDLNDLPLGEQRRFVQHGHFLWVDNSSLLDEQNTIEDFAFEIRRFAIPWAAKLNLATYLYRDVYSGCADQSAIEKIKNAIL